MRRCLKHPWSFIRPDGVDHVYCSGGGGYFPMALYRCVKCGAVSRKYFRKQDRRVA